MLVLRAPGLCESITSTVLSPPLLTLQPRVSASNWEGGWEEGMGGGEGGRREWERGMGEGDERR